jgi:hypothetical protein
MKKLFNLFKPSKALALIVLLNNFINREIFQDYVYKINDYIDVKRDYRVERTISSRKQSIVCNKWKFIKTFFIFSNYF